jgi:DTW domain-containing protein YfiP
MTYCHFCLQSIECLCMFKTPMKVVVSLQIIQWPTNDSIVLNKSSIVASEA